MDDEMHSECLAVDLGLPFERSLEGTVKEHVQSVPCDSVVIWFGKAHDVGTGAFWKDKVLPQSCGVVWAQALSLKFCGTHLRNACSVESCNFLTGPCFREVRCRCDDIS